MKGLIRNNFYKVEGSLKSTLLISAACALVLLLVGKTAESSNYLLGFTIAGILGGYGSLTVTAIQQDAASKWDKFELTLPVRRKDVVTARYISSLLYILIGFFISILSILPFYIVTGSIDLERVGFGLTFGLGFALAISTFMIPLVMLFGTDKVESMMLVSVIAGLLLLYGYNMIVTLLFKDASLITFVFRIGYIALSLLLFFLSYLISCGIYKKKEL